MKSPNDHRFQQWENDPEPKTEADYGEVLMETAEEKTFLYDVSNEEEAWLTFTGNTPVLEQ